MSKITQKMQEKAHKLGLGATGRFPAGKVFEHDEDKIRIIIGTYHNEVVIHFGASVTFIALTPKQALDLAAMLQKHVKTLVITNKNCTRCGWWRNRNSTRKGVAIPDGTGKCTRPEGHCDPDIVKGKLGEGPIVRHRGGINTTTN